MSLPRGRWRFWLDYYRDELRLARATVIFSLGLGLFIGGLVWLYSPTGPAETVEGRVKAFGFHETKFGSSDSDRHH